jgi:hypothetical protein
MLIRPVAKDADEANHLMSGLNFPAAVDECATWCNYLIKERKVTKVGVTGFCMGLCRIIHHDTMEYFINLLFKENTCFFLISWDKLLNFT